MLRPRLDAVAHVTSAPRAVGGECGAPDALRGGELGAVPVRDVANALGGQRVAGVSALSSTLDKAPGVHESRVPGSGVRGRGSGKRETTASSLAGKEESSRKEDNSGQGKDGPAEAIAQGGMDGDVDFLREALRVLVEGIMDAEVSSRIGAEYGERSPEPIQRRSKRNWVNVLGVVRTGLIFQVGFQSYARVPDAPLRNLPQPCGCRLGLSPGTPRLRHLSSCNLSICSRDLVVSTSWCKSP